MVDGVGELSMTIEVLSTPSTHPGSVVLLNDAKKVTAGTQTTSLGPRGEPAVEPKVPTRRDSASANTPTTGAGPFALFERGRSLPRWVSSDCV
jgi:hypothetical protein